MRMRLSDYARKYPFVMRNGSGHANADVATREHEVMQLPADLPLTDRLLPLVGIRS